MCVRCEMIYYATLYITLHYTIIVIIIAIAGCVWIVFSSHHFGIILKWFGVRYRTSECREDILTWQMHTQTERGTLE